MLDTELAKAERDFDREIDLACERGDKTAAQRCFSALMAAQKAYFASEPETVKDVIKRLNRLIHEGCDLDPSSRLQPIRPTLVEVRRRLSKNRSTRDAAASLWRALQLAELFEADDQYLRLLFGCIKGLERPGLARN